MNRWTLPVWCWVLGSYFLLACLFFYPFFQGKVIFYIDNLLHIAPAYTFWKNEILSGRLPLWISVNREGFRPLSWLRHVERNFRASDNSRIRALTGPSYFMRISVSRSSCLFAIIRTLPWVVPPVKKNIESPPKNNPQGVTFFS